MTIIARIHTSKPRRAILATGGAGFIGSHLVEALHAEGGWRVVVVDNFDQFYDPQIKRANLAPHLLSPNLKLYEADIEDLEALQAIFTDNGFSAIVHLAARAGVLPSLSQPNKYFDTNFNGTLNLLQCAREFDVKQFLFGHRRVCTVLVLKLLSPRTTRAHSLSLPMQHPSRLVKCFAIHTLIFMKFAASASV